MYNRGLTESRTRAQSLVLAGEVSVNGEKVTKAGARVSRDDIITVNSGPVWASRGALKLLKAIKVFSVNPLDRICVDIGASSGGFTDVLLSMGAKRVFAVDVGYGQLEWKLRNDPKVTVMERTNARNLQAEDFDVVPELAVVDVSFISLKKILPAVERILVPDEGECVCLVKPQFEAGRNAVGKNGVVRDKKTHLSVLLSLKDYIESIRDMQLSGVDYSPLLGASGNMEFLFHIKMNRTPLTLPVNEVYIESLVEKAHAFHFTKSDKRT